MLHHSPLVLIVSADYVAKVLVRDGLLQLSQIQLRIIADGGFKSSDLSRSPADNTQIGWGTLREFGKGVRRLIFVLA